MKHSKQKSVIFSIAANELKMIFTTPVAWIMLSAFAVLCGVFFSDVFKMYAQASESGSHLSFITEGVFSSDYLGLFNKVQTYIFMFIPLVSMGIMSRDMGTGSMKLLESSPVSEIQTVIGKYLSLVCYGLAMMAVVGIYAAYGCYAIVNPDIPLILTGMLGLFLLICTYSAIGLFMSSLTSYQVVSAISTFTVLAVLSAIGNFGQDIPLVRDITWWLSVSGRCEEFISGLICSEDVIYFLMLTVFFLALTVIRLSNRRKSRSIPVRCSLYAGTVLCLVFLGFLSSQPQLMSFYDSTQTKKRTITVPSQEVMNRVKGPVKITTYTNILDEEGFYLGIPSRYNVDKEYLKPFIRFKPDIRLDYEYYWADAGSASVRRRFPDLDDRQRADRIADVYDMDIDMFKTPSQISEIIDLSGEGYRLVRQIKLEDGRSTFLRIFDDSQRLPGEKEITAAFKRLVDGAVGVGFLCGHGERDINKEGDSDYYAFANAKRFRHSLLNNGFDAVSVSLSDGKSIPDSLNILVIADPRMSFSDKELEQIEEYIDRGGNLILAAEPVRQKYANEVASLFGARFLDGRIVVPVSDSQQNLILSDVALSGLDIMPELSALRRAGYKITMPNAVGINTENVKNYTAVNLLLSAANGWNEFQTVDFANDVATMDSDRNEKVGSRSVASVLTRELENGRQQRILLLGDADCFSNSELMRERYAVASGNFTFLYQVFKWMSYGEYPIDTPRPHGKDNAIRIGVNQAEVLKWVLCAVLPLIMLLASLMIVVRRKSR